MTSQQPIFDAITHPMLLEMVRCINRERSNSLIHSWARTITEPHVTATAKVVAIVAAFGSPSAQAAACLSVGMDIKVVVVRARQPGRADLLREHIEVRDERGQWVTVEPHPVAGDVQNAYVMESEIVRARSVSHGCGDCAVKEGQLHEPGCDMERCPFCGGQLITCDCAVKHFYPGYVGLRDRIPARDSMPSEEERAHAKACQLPDCAACASLQARGLTSGLPTRVYFDGLPDDEQEEWDRRLEAKGRVPWIAYPNICRRCGDLWPDMFHVSDDEWSRYVAPEIRDCMLCLPCYTWIKQCIDDAALSRGTTHERGQR